MPRVGKRGPRGYQKRAAVKAAAERARLEGRAPTTKELQRDGIVRKGGARPGAGKPRGVPWDRVKSIVEKTGVSFEEIIGHPMIPAKCLEDPATVSKIRDLVERSLLVFRMNLREAMARKGMKDLSVTALLGLARNTAGLDFDKQQASAGAGEPDLAGLEIKIDELLERLAKRRRERAPDVGAATPSKERESA